MSQFVIVRHEQCKQAEFVGVQSCQVSLDGFLTIFDQPELKPVARWSALPGYLTEGARHIFQIFTRGRSTSYYALELK